MNNITVNIGCKSEFIDAVLSEIGGKLRSSTRKVSFIDGGIESTITIFQIHVLDELVKAIASVIKVIPGVIFVEPVREEVITYEFESTDGDAV